MKKIIIIMTILLLIATSADAQTTLVWRSLRGRPSDLRGLPAKVTELEGRVDAIEAKQVELEDRITALETANLSDDQMLIGAGLLLTAIGLADLADYRKEEIQYQVSAYQIGDTVYDENGNPRIWDTERRDHWSAKANEMETAISRVNLFTSDFNQKLIDMPENDRQALIQELQRIETAISARIDLILLQD